MHSVKEKNARNHFKTWDDWVDGNEAFKLGLRKISTEHNDNWKTILK
jgi:hypothetical protein